MTLTSKEEKQRRRMINFTTKDIRKQYLKNGCNVIGNKKVWKRNCPKCDEEIFYSSRDAFVNGIKRNSICRSCSHTKHFGPFIKKCPKCKIEMVYDRYKSYLYSVENDGWCHKCAGSKTIKTRIKRKNLYGRRNQSKSSRQKMSFYHRGKNNPFYGQKHTNETRRKLRLNTIKYIEKIKGGKMFPLYNKKSCEYFQKMEKNKGWNGFYATKNGEYFIKDLGYWVDYYEPNENIVIEWDEPSHYNVDGKLKKER